tara:strand:- start:3599 stop:3796 length:198 start_codon:yes stop_codon:yes gene_type:complete
MSLYIVFQCSHSTGVSTGWCVFQDCPTPRAAADMFALHDRLKECLAGEYDGLGDAVILNWEELPA